MSSLTFPLVFVLLDFVFVKHSQVEINLQRYMRFLDKVPPRCEEFNGRGRGRIGKYDVTFGRAFAFDARRWTAKEEDVVWFLRSFVPFPFYRGCPGVAIVD